MRTRNINVGDKFGNLTVLEELEREEDYRGLKTVRVFRCQCKCGNIIDVRLFSLIYCDKKSCGCDKAKVKPKQDQITKLVERYKKRTNRR
jgi:hypothetical protein